MLAEKNELSILQEFARSIKLRRILREWTQQEASDRMGICTNYLQRLERGVANPSLTTIISILQAFDITFPQLLKIQVKET